MHRSLLLLVALALQGAGESTVPPKHRNHLANETSPYLLAHASNPVDWYPWGPEALERAKAEDKPILLSIGYSACHWCHVMERECFEDEEIADLMNRWFVCIKVDREERPDLDRLYMDAVQRMTGSGGWPLNVFLTPDLVPFFGGTYFPPKSRGGRPGWVDVLKSVHDAWVHQREAVERSGAQLLEALREAAEADEAGKVPGVEVLQRAVELSVAAEDPLHGGFAAPPRFAPKFPRCTQLRFLLREAARTGADQPLRMVTTALDAMASGGIRDQLAGGFHRYSTDRTWTVPHFEKMLYDNAQLAVVYLEAWQARGDDRFRGVARDVLDYLLREMASPEGGFYSTTDADSEGEEGKYFVWTADEVREVCGEDADVALSWWGVTPEGNFEGRNVLTARTTIAEVAKRTGREPAEVEAAIGRCRRALLQRRQQRVPPQLDDKVLASWNGLALSAFARAAALLGDEHYLAAARRNAAFLLEKMRDEDGRMLRVRRLGRSKIRGMLEDHAFVEAGLLDLFEVDQDRRWLRAALELQGIVDRAFADPRGGYYSVADDHEALPLRPSSASESSLPSDVGTALMNLARLSLLAGDPEGLERVRRGLSRYASELLRYPTAFGQLLILLEFLEANPPEVYVVGPAGDPRVERELDRWRRLWPPHRVIARVAPGGDETLGRMLPATRGKDLVNGEPAVYVCHEGVCEAPRVLRP